MNNNITKISKNYKHKYAEYGNYKYSKCFINISFNKKIIG